MNRFPRMANEAYYTPPSAVWPLANALPLRGLRLSRFRLWEPAGGAGHVAKVIADVSGKTVFASDLHAAKRCVYPVSDRADFFTSTGPSGGGPLAIITNPPYGAANRLAVDFLGRALELARPSGGLVAMLLPFEFDCAASRIAVVAEHPAFAFKLTLTRRIRWINLPQKRNAPMKHHAWFVWDFNADRLAALRALGQIRAA